MRSLRPGRVGLQSGPRAVHHGTNRKTCARQAVRALARPAAAADTNERGSRNSGAAEDCKVQGTLSALDAFLEPKQEAPPSQPDAKEALRSEPATAPVTVRSETAAQADDKRAQSGAAASTSGAAPAGQDEVVQSLWAFALQWLRDHVRPTRLVSQDDTDLPRAKPRLAYGVLAANLAVYGTGLGFRFLEGDIGPQDFFLSLASVNEAVEAGEYYRIVSANFLHDSFAHLCASSYALLTVAPEAEAVLGPLAFGASYLLGGAAGTTLCFLLTDTLTVGASSGIFGLIGALGAYLYKNHKVPNSSDQLLFTAGLLTFNIVVGHKADSAIDNLGHLGGLLAGIYLGWLLTPAVIRLPQDPAAPGQAGEQSRLSEPQPGEARPAGAAGAAAEPAEQQQPAAAACEVRVQRPNPLQSAVVLLCVATTIASSVAAAVIYRTGELPLPRPPTWLM